MMGMTFSDLRAYRWPLRFHNGSRVHLDPT